MFKVVGGTFRLNFGSRDSLISIAAFFGSTVADSTDAGVSVDGEEIPFI